MVGGSGKMIWEDDDILPILWYHKLLSASQTRFLISQIRFSDIANFGYILYKKSMFISVFKITISGLNRHILEYLFIIKNRFCGRSLLLYVNRFCDITVVCPSVFHCTSSKWKATYLSSVRWLNSSIEHPIVAYEEIPVYNKVASTGY